MIGDKAIDVLRLLPIAVGIWRPEGADLRCVFYNYAAINSTDGLNQTGLLLGETLPGHRLRDADGCTRLERYLGIASGALPPWVGYLQYEGPELSTKSYWQSATRIELGDAGHLLVLWTTEQTLLTQQLERMAMTDPLTGLYSRHYGEHCLKQAVAAHLNGTSTSNLIYIDLDNFKTVNDTRGHAGGDAVLVEVARRMRGITHGNDPICRWGGDEFIAILWQMPEMDAISTAERIRIALAEPYQIDGATVLISASIGVAPILGDAESALAAADRAAYSAKNTGGNAVVAGDKATKATITLLRRLDKAIENREFLLHYQPVVALDTGEVAGYEALVRWQDGDRLVSAQEFIEDLENHGEIWRLCEQIMLMAGDAISTLPEPLWVSVNLSPKTLERKDFHRIVAPIKKSRAHFEVTERLFLSVPAIAKIDELKSRGGKIALDDFGIGLSRFSLLPKADLLKIDREYVTNLTWHAESLQTCRALIAMATNLGLRVVAEGVETAATATALRVLGCHYGQGWFFGKPEPIAKTISSREKP